MVEVFKTDVHNEERAIMLLSVLSQRFPSHRINFDLEDCDRILRVEGLNILPENIISVLNAYGYQCLILD